MSTTYILGAGFSRAIAQSMPLLGELGRQVEQRYTHRLRLSQSVRRDIRNRLEQSLTRLASYKPWLSEADNLRERALYLDLANVIRSLLEEATQEAAHLLHMDAPDWLETLLAKWHGEKASVISLNYDTLLEQIASSFHPPGAPAGLKLATEYLYPVALTPASRRQGQQFFGAEPATTFSLYKLHGSINWYYSGAEEFFGETIYFTQYSDGLAGVWREHPSELQKAEARAVVDKIPLIVPPTTDKSSFLQHETSIVVVPRAPGDRARRPRGLHGIFTSTERRRCG